MATYTSNKMVPILMVSRMVALRVWI
jgi:hypothetical protein